MAPDEHGEPVPAAFVLGAHRVEVVEVLDRWLASEHSYFKLRGSDGDVYILRHAAGGAWHMTLFQAARSDDTRLSGT